MTEPLTTQPLKADENPEELPQRQPAQEPQRKSAVGRFCVNIRERFVRFINSCRETIRNCRDRRQNRTGQGSNSSYNLNNENNMWVSNDNTLPRKCGKKLVDDTTNEHSSDRDSPYQQENEELYGVGGDYRIVFGDDNIPNNRDDSGLKPETKEQDSGQRTSVKQNSEHCTFDNQDYDQQTPGHKETTEQSLGCRDEYIPDSGYQESSQDSPGKHEKGHHKHTGLQDTCPEDSVYKSVHQNLQNSERNSSIQPDSGHQTSSHHRSVLHTSSRHGSGQHDTGHHGSVHHTSNHHDSGHHDTGHQTPSHHDSGHQTPSHHDSGHQTSSHHDSSHHDSGHHTSSYDSGGVGDYGGGDSGGGDYGGGGGDSGGGDYGGCD